MIIEEQASMGKVKQSLQTLHQGVLNQEKALTEGGFWGGGGIWGGGGREGAGRGRDGSLVIPV